MHSPVKDINNRVAEVGDFWIQDSPDWKIREYIFRSRWKPAFSVLIRTLHPPIQMLVTIIPLFQYIITEKNAEW